MSCSTPIVFIIFRRPQLTARVFEVIRQVQPLKLFIVADGPRNEYEALQCHQARLVTEKIDWECEVLRNYSDVNLGCRKRVSSGLAWVFEQVEEAIILEDDCLPDKSFFVFCKTLLERYKHDHRIWTISGNNFQDRIRRGDSSYFFSKYPFIWGWATWKRAWDSYDANFDLWSEEFAMQVIQSVCNDVDECEFRLQRFKDVMQGNIDSWDPRWLFTCWANHALCVIPQTNLVSNIGFGPQSTHTSDQDFPYANLDTESITEIHHPEHVFRDVLADQYAYDFFFGGRSRKESKTLKFKIVNKLKTILSL